MFALLTWQFDGGAAVGTGAVDVGFEVLPFFFLKLPLSCELVSQLIVFEVFLSAFIMISRKCAEEEEEHNG